MDMLVVPLEFAHDHMVSLPFGRGGKGGGGDGDVFEGDYRPVVCHYRHLY